MKVCNKCKIEKAYEEFNKKGQGYQPLCRNCQHEVHKNWYQNNRRTVTLRVKDRREEIRIWWKEYKSKISCSLCNENHPATLDFHHTDNNKEFNIATAVVTGYSIERILLEVNKCIVLCSNCHRKTHYTEVV